MACITVTVLVDMFRRVCHIHDSHIGICSGDHGCNIVRLDPTNSAVGIYLLNRSEYCGP